MRCSPLRFLVRHGGSHFDDAATPTRSILITMMVGVEEGWIVQERQKVSPPFLTSSWVNLAFIVFAAIVTVVNTLAIVFYDGDVDWRMLSTIIVPPSALVFFVVIHRRCHRLQGYSHVVFLYGIAVIAILDRVDSIYGLGFAMLGTYLMYRYELFTPPRLAKIIVLLSVLISAIIISAFRISGWSNAITTLAFLAFFSIILLLAELDWINRYQRARGEVETAMTMVGKQIDLMKAGLTKREIEVVRELVGTKGTDKEVGYNLGISVDTVRNHLKSIRMKLQVASKLEVIEASRWFITSHPKVEDAEANSSQIDGSTGTPLSG
jgi:DNA-binding CsgD family transcriptional regulator